MALSFKKMGLASRRYMIAGAQAIAGDVSPNWSPHSPCSKFLKKTGDSSQLPTPSQPVSIEIASRMFPFSSRKEVWRSDHSTADDPETADDSGAGDFQSMRSHATHVGLCVREEKRKKLDSPSKNKQEETKRASGHNKLQHNRPDASDRELQQARRSHLNYKGIHHDDWQA